MTSAVRDRRYTPQEPVAAGTAVASCRTGNLRRPSWPRPHQYFAWGGNRDVVTYISRAELATWLGYLAVSF